MGTTGLVPAILKVFWSLIQKASSVGCNCPFTLGPQINDCHEFRSIGMFNTLLIVNNIFGELKVPIAFPYLHLCTWDS